MAIVVRYFSTTSAGAGDGTTWADRAAFISGGAYSTVLTGFNFGGSDAMEARLGPGNYTLPNDFSAARFTVAAPTARNPLYLFGANSDGTAIAPNYSWNAAESDFDSTGLPNFITGSSFTLQLPSCRYRCVSLACPRGGDLFVASVGTCFENCIINNTASSTNAGCGPIIESMEFVNCQLECSGTAWNRIVTTSGTSPLQALRNCRIKGTSTASSGNRNGVLVAGNTTYIFGRNCTLLNIPGSGIIHTATASTSTGLKVVNCTIYNCGTAINIGSDASTSGQNIIDKCFIANCTTGITATTLAAIVRSSRIRVSGTALTLPANSYESDNDTSAGSDSAEFVNAAGGDLRIKSSSIYWGKGIGAADEMTSGGTARPTSPFNQQVIA